MRAIALCNQKGGVGKTTCAINLGAALVRLGERVLLVDLDPQAHLTCSLGIPPPEASVYDLIRGERSLRELVVKSGGLEVVPSSPGLAGVDVELSSTRGREYLLRDALGLLRGYDYVFIDCPPSLGLLTVNALTTAREVYIPLQVEFLALQGLARLLETVEIVRERLNGGLEVTGVIGTRYDRRRTLNREVVERIRAHFGRRFFRTLIRENIALAEAPSHGLSIFDYRPRAHGAEDFMSLAREVVKRYEGRRK